MLSVYLPDLGEVVVLVESIQYQNGKYNMRCHNVNGVIYCSKISWQEDYVYEYGWVNIVGYSINGTVVSCNCYSSIG